MTDFAVDRPSWAVMGPTIGSMETVVGGHVLYWTSKGDLYRCPQCHKLRTMDEFETSPECDEDAPKRPWWRRWFG